MSTEELEMNHEHLVLNNADSTAHRNISVTYAIGVLLEVANPDYQIISDGQCGVISIPQDSIYDKIKELKKLL